MKKENKTLKEMWMAVLDRSMTKEQLLLIAYSHEEYSPEFLELIKETLALKYGITEKELDSLPEKGRIVNGTIGTRDLLIETLQKMNIKYEMSPDDDSRLWFEWQGGTFGIFVRRRTGRRDRGRRPPLCGDQHAAQTRRRAGNRASPFRG